MRHNTAAQGIWETTPGLAQRLSVLHADPAQFSCSQIAAKLSSEFDVVLSKNAVIGKSRRMALAFRAPRPVEARVYKYKYRPRLKLVSKPRVENGTVTFDAMRWDDCHYPLGDYPHLYCGEEVSAGSSYCPTHYKLTHQAPRKVWE